MFQRLNQKGCKTSDLLVNLVNYFLQPLPHDKILDVIKLKAFVDDKTKVAKMTISVFDRVENLVGNGENAGYQHLLLFSQCFQKASFLGSLKVGIVWKRVNSSLKL